MLENLGFSSCNDGSFRLSKILKIHEERILGWSLNGGRFLNKTFNWKCSDGPGILHSLIYC